MYNNSKGFVKSRIAIQMMQIAEVLIKLHEHNKNDMQI